MGNITRFWQWVSVVIVIVMIFAGVEYSWRFNGSNIFLVLIAMVGVFLVIGYILFRDITNNYKQTEQTLQQRERYLAALNNAGGTPVGIQP